MATKATSGHDENIPFARMEAMVGKERAREARAQSLEIYRRASAHAEARGILLADTKLEFGVKGGRLVWIDEALTPDSSRFWPAERYQPGKAQESYDKQYVRDYLEEIRWNKQPPAPALPPEVARKTSEKYLEAYHQLTGRELDV
jgi:phosphoribosylaminoimidazole-succinocarboxamide synthase